jgi:YbbR-like protein
MNRPLKRMGEVIFQNAGWKLLSLLTAVVIWALVASEPEMATFTTVRLEYKNMPDDLEIGAEPEESVRLELKGPSGELRGDGLRPAVVIDVSGVGTGQHTFTIGDRNVRLARGVRLVRATPPEVSLTFEQHAERTVPIEVRWTGAAPDGFRVQPQAIGIEGPSSHVARIAAAVTDPVDVSRMPGSSVKVNLVTAPQDSYVRFKSVAQATVRVGK